MPIREKSFTTEVRAASGADGASVISGYAAVYNSKSEVIFENGKLFREIIAPGCFTKTLQENGAIKCLWNHNRDMVLGSRKAGTLTLSDDGTGLKFECRPVNGVTYCDDALRTIQAGNVDQMSFWFVPIHDTWSTDTDGVALRTVTEAKLMEVSPVAWPAYEASTVQARSGDVFGDLADTVQRRARATEGKDKADLRAVLIQLLAIITDPEPDMDDSEECEDDAISEDPAQECDDPNDNTEPSQADIQGQQMGACNPQERARIDRMRITRMNSTHH
jgi:HK97 family phage prohead protease